MLPRYRVWVQITAGIEFSSAKKEAKHPKQSEQLDQHTCPTVSEKDAGKKRIPFAVLQWAEVCKGLEQARKRGKDLFTGRLRNLIQVAGPHAQDE